MAADGLLKIHILFTRLYFDDSAFSVKGTTADCLVLFVAQNIISNIKLNPKSQPFIKKEDKML